MGWEVVSFLAGWLSSQQGTQLGDQFPLFSSAGLFCRVHSLHRLCTCRNSGKKMKPRFHNFPYGLASKKELSSRDKRERELWAYWHSPFLFLAEFMLLESFLHFCSKYPGVFSHYWPRQRGMHSLSLSRNILYPFSLCTQNLPFPASLFPNVFPSSSDINKEEDGGMGWQHLNWWITIQQITHRVGRWVGKQETKKQARLSWRKWTVYL